MILTTGALTKVVSGRAILNALVVALGTEEIGDGLRVVGSIRSLSVRAFAGEDQGGLAREHRQPLI